MVPVAVSGNISREATIPSGNIFAEATRGIKVKNCLDRQLTLPFLNAPEVGNCWAEV